MLVPLLVIAISMPILKRMVEDNRKILSDLRYANHPLNDLYDPDLERIATSKLGINEGSAPTWKTCPSGGCEMPSTQYTPSTRCEYCEEDKLTAFHFRQLAESNRFLGEYPNYLDDTELWLIQEGILHPERLIWCNGYALEPCNPDDLKRFLEIKNMAYLKGDYNSLPLDDGGEEKIMIDWFRMKGCSTYGAERLYYAGFKPWEFEW